MKTKIRTKKLKNHYYKIYTDECVLCGRGSTFRERNYGKKPKITHFYTQNACGCHF